MKVDSLNPRQLFDGNVHYEIPVYQRPYVWSEEDQWAPLWSDIERVADKVAQAHDDAGAIVADHFLGAVVYESKAPVVGDVTRHLIIDGQQRTTTLQILIDAVRLIMQERGHDTLADDLEELVLNGSNKFKGKAERFKLWPSRGDRKAFSQAMDPQSGWEGEHRIILAHEYFKGEARGWLAGEADADGVVPPGTEEERVVALSSTLQHRLYLVTINLTGHDDSQLIFETLNDRGTPLLKADLVKNWIFQRGSQAGAQVDLWPDTHWSDFDDNWWREEITQGRHSRSRVDIFFQYWLTMRLRDEVATEHVFRIFTEHARPQFESVSGCEEFLSELRNDADTFRGLGQLEGATEQGQFYSRVIETMELAATSPLLMWLLSKNHSIAAPQVSLALRSLESWVIRRTLLRYTMKDVNKLMVAILKELERVPREQAGTAVADFLSRQTADARIWPSDADVRRSLPRTRLYGNVRQGRLRVVLEAVEHRLRTEKHESVSLPAGLEIEHVMPQGWRTYWDPEPKLAPEAAAARDRRLNRLGNLTLVTKKLNGSLSHRPWTDQETGGMGTGDDAGKGKRGLLEKYSLLLLSRKLTQEHADSWTEDDILQRSVELTETIIEVWPGPDAAGAKSG